MTFRLHPRLALAAVFLAVLACSDTARNPASPPPTEEPTGPAAPELVVRVERPVHGPEVGVRVILEELEGEQRVRDLRTGPDGEARFSDVAPGRHIVSLVFLDGSNEWHEIDVGPPYPARFEVVLDALEGVSRVGVEPGDQIRLWGERAELRVAEVPAAIDSIVWRSLSDFYQGPVILGRGRDLGTTALAVGTTTVEARLFRGDRVVAMGRANVDVGYRAAWNVVLEGRALVDENLADVWVDGDHAYVPRGDGISIVRIDGAIGEVGRFSQSDLFNRDVKVADGFAYLSNEAGSREAAVIVDVSDPRRPRRVSAIEAPEEVRVHNLWYDDGRLYTAMPGVGFRAYDVSDPMNPRLVGSLGSRDGPRFDAHDVHARGGLVFGAVMRSRDEDLVVARSPDLTRIGAAGWDGSRTHTAWLSEDGRHLYVTDERENAPIRILDVTDPANPVLVGTYQPRLGAVPHNFQVRDGRLAFLSHYVHGVEVVDVSDPTEPVLVGFFDTHPGSEGGGFAGAWGVHWDERGRFVVSDRAAGLFVLRYTGPGGP